MLSSATSRVCTVPLRIRKLASPAPPPARACSDLLVRHILPFVPTYQVVLEALAEPTRRGLVERLATGPASVAELASGLPISRPAVSQHLKVLRDAGLVDFDERGTRNVYRLEPAGLESLRTWLDRFWQDALDAFETHAHAVSKTRRST
ncbi:MAG: ArsR/SmtB family transcription factor [Acidimicrobiales bacterium]